MLNKVVTFNKIKKKKKESDFITIYRSSGLQRIGAAIAIVL